MTIDNIKEEIYNAFHNGKIKLNIRLPKLFSDFVNEITDPQLLADIAEGKVVIKSKSEIDDEIECKDYSKDKPYEKRIEPISDSEYRRLEEEINNGGDNILTPLSKASHKVFTYRLPSSNPFKRNSNKPDNEQQKCQETINFLDDEQVNAYINKIKGFDPSDVNNIINLLNEKNDRKLSINSRKMLQQKKTVQAYDTTRRRNKHQTNPYNNPMKQNVMSIFDRRKMDQSTLDLERGLIESITANNYIR